MYWPSPTASSEQSLRAIWGAVSRAAVLIWLQIKLNSQLSSCVCVCVCLVNNGNHSSCLFHLKHEQCYCQKYFSSNTMLVFPFHVKYMCVYTYMCVYSHFTNFITVTLQTIFLFPLVIKKDTATPVSPNNISSSFSKSITAFIQFSAHFSRLNSLFLFLFKK